MGFIHRTRGAPPCGGVVAVNLFPFSFGFQGEFRAITIRMFPTLG